MKVLVTTTSFQKPQNAAARALLESEFQEIVYNVRGVPLRKEEILELVQGCDAYIAGLDYLSADVIEKLPPELKVISRYGVGIDRVDVRAAAKRGIVVTNTPGANANAVCELAFTLMLCVARDIPRMHQAVEAGEWLRGEGVELAGKTLGVVGLGAIGKRLAIRAKAFEMNVLAYDPYFDQDFAQTNGVCQTDLDTLFARSDFVSLHVPLTEQTKHMVDRRCIAQMKRGAVLINTARGGLIDEAAAAQAIATGKLGGIGLDAFEQEPLTESPLKGLPHVVFTPHIGAHTSEAVSKMGLMSVQNAIAVVKGLPCKYVVKLQAD